VKNKILNKIKNVIEEGKKLTFPKKNEVYLTSINIVFIVLFSALVIIFTDFIISNIIKILFGLGN
jgi:preprotein translocase SecE subunit